MYGSKEFGESFDGLKIGKLDKLLSLGGCSVRTRSLQQVKDLLANQMPMEDNVLHYRLLKHAYSTSQAAAIQPLPDKAYYKCERCQPVLWVDLDPSSKIKMEKGIYDHANTFHSPQKVEKMEEDSTGDATDQEQMDIDAHCSFENLNLANFPASFQSCGGTITDLSSLEKESLVGHSAAYIIQLRSGKKAESGLHICEKHQKFFGKDFEFHFKKSCFFPGHTGMAKPTKKITVELSEYYLYEKDMVLPCSSKVCSSCLMKMIKSREESGYAFKGSQEYLLAVVGSQPSNPASTPNEGGKLNLTGATTDSSQDSTRGGQSKEETTKMILRRLGQELIKVDDPNFYNKTKAMWGIAHKNINDYHKASKNYLLQEAAAGIKAILTGLTDIPDDRINIWMNLVKSGRMEKELAGARNLIQNEMLQSIIKSYNAAKKDQNLRIQVLSLAASNFTFHQLDQFNVSKDKQESKDGDPEDEGSKDEEPEDGIVRFNPPLTRGFYRKALDHYDAFGTALMPRKKEKQSRWHFSQELMTLFVDFITSEEIQQSVAFGTLLIKMEDGKKERIARCIRRLNQSQIITQFISYCTASHPDIKCPSRSTLGRFLREFPAAAAKNIKGLDSTYENHKRAFDTLAEIIKKAASIVEKIDEGPGPTLQYVLETNEILSTYYDYLLRDYPFKVGFEHETLSHCVTCATSNPTNKNLQENCKSRHPTDCDYCNLLPTLEKKFTEIIEHLKDHVLELQHEEMMLDAQKCFNDIKLYTHQILRNYANQVEVKRILDAFMILFTIDYAMNFLPYKYRETQPEFFGKVSSF